MFCGKCGKKNEDTALFCGGCGAKLKPVSREGGNQSDKNNLSISKNVRFEMNNKKLGVMVVLSLVAVFVAAVVVKINSGYVDTVDIFMDVQKKNASVGTLLELIPDEAINQWMSEYGYTDYGEMVESLNAALCVADDYSDWEISNYSISETVDANRGELKLVKKSYEKIDVKVSDAKKIKLEIWFRNEDEYQFINDNVYLVKIGCSWYIDIISWGTYGY